MLIYKLFRQDEWDTLKRDGQTDGTPVDLADGCIHFSTADQIAETARRYFADVDPLILVRVETDKLGDALVWELSRGGDLFPHLYAKLQMDHVVDMHIVSRYENGDANFEGLI